MGLFLLVSQVCCLLAVAANGYVLFAANLEDFRNLAKKFVPEKLAEKLTEIVSESSVQYRQIKADRGDRNSDEDRGFQKRKIDSRYESEKIPGRSRDRMHRNEQGDFERTPSKKKRLYDDSDAEGMKDSKFEKKKSFKNIYDHERDQEREYDRMDITTFTSKDRRYRTVQRMPSSKQWYDQAPSYFHISTKEENLVSYHYTTPKSTYEIHEKLKHPDTDIEDNKREMEERYNKRQTTREKSVMIEEFEYENPSTTTKKRLPKQLINGRDVKQKQIKKQEAKGNKDMIFDTIFLNKNKGDYEGWPEKDEDYYSKEAVKTPVNSKKTGREHSSSGDIENEDTTMRVAKNNKPQVMYTEIEPSVVEKDEEDDEEPKAEEVKARTENLLFNFEENVTDNFIIKSSGIPTRERYKMSSPDYYKKLPRIVEKYDFNEPIPEADREREKIDDRLALVPARVNNKVKQQFETSRNFEDLGLTL